ncbi:MAG: hypothetical protein V3R47_00880 [candidate division NC10 bacterium]
MLQGQQQATLRGVKAFEIHGQTYYDILYELEGGERGTGRVAPEVIYPDPKVGDRVMLHFLMGMVTQVERVLG